MNMYQQQTIMILISCITVCLKNINASFKPNHKPCHHISLYHELAILE